MAKPCPPPIGKALFHGGKRSRCLIIPVERVIDERMLVAFDIFNARSKQSPLPLFVGDPDRDLPPRGKEVESSCEFDTEVVVCHGFHEIIERLYLVSFYRKLGHIGDENDDDVLVRLSHLARHLHAVPVGQLDVEKKQIIIVAEFFEKTDGGNEMRDDGDGMPAVKPRDITFKQIRRCLFVLQNRDSYTLLHTRPSPDNFRPCPPVSL